MLVWGHSVHFAKFPMLRFLKCYSSHRSELISAKLYGYTGNHIGIQAITFLGDLAFEKYGTLNFS